MNGHRFAPWSCNDNTEQVFDRDGQVIAETYNDNARLIAAAPELLAALETLMAMDVRGHALMDRLQFTDAGRAILRQCQEAISKATGKEWA